MSQQVTKLADFDGNPVEANGLLPGWFACVINHLILVALSPASGTFIT
ncbi:hypothetical protein ACFC2F_03510 [Enterobacter sichuanensis]|nr:hypothetical protein [Enterobacter sp.]MCI8903512.1 hypothetical protein [Enterobacter sp.]